MNDQKFLFNNQIVNFQDYLDSNIPSRRWEVGYDYKTKFYLTDDEYEYFHSKLKEGSTMVKVGELILTNKFLYIAPIKEKPKKPNFEPVMDEQGNIIKFREV